MEEAESVGEPGGREDTKEAQPTLVLEETPFYERPRAKLQFQEDNHKLHLSKHPTALPLNTPP